MNSRHRTQVARLIFVSLFLSIAFPLRTNCAEVNARQTGIPSFSVVQTSTPKISPSPTPAVNAVSPGPSPTPALVGNGNLARSLAELQTRIGDVLHKPELSSGLIGIKIVSLDSGRVLFEENSSKLLRPASNMKLYTVAAAMDRLTPDFRFVTSVYAPAPPTSTGLIKGDLTIFGRGDPSLAARFNNGDYYKGIDDLAARIVAAGVKRIEGDLVGDESYFTGPQYGSGWEWEDLTWYYGAEVSSLTINDNALDLFIKPGSEAGKPATITTGPPDPLLVINNKVITAPKGTRRSISVYRELGEDTITISGSIAIDDRGYTGGIGISHPALLFVYLLRSALAQKGVVVTGKSRVVRANEGPTLNPAVTLSKLTSATISQSTSSKTEIATLKSPPFGRVAAETLKPSQNLYTELILRTLGKVTPPPVNADGSETSEELGLEVVKSFLKTVGIRPESMVLDDGSGLSRNDMITADASVQLLTFMSKHRYSEVFRDALPIAGVDGTLRNRMKNTLAENNVRAKTGSLSAAASLAGYVTTAAGERLAFSIMVNNYPSDVEPRLVCIDPIAVLLASFAAKSQ